MSFNLNEKCRKLKPYEPEQGSYAIRLDANESFIRPSEALEGKIEKAVSDTCFFRYPDTLAPELIKAAGRYYGVDPSFITAGNGSDELIGVILSAFLQKGDTMLTIEPDFSMYRFYAKLMECDCVTVKKDESFVIDESAVIEKAKESGAAIIIFSNPCNPTSIGLTREKVRKIVKSVNALVILDEAYMEFYDQSMLGEIEQFDNLIILRTCSKAVGMAGIRLGFAIANEQLTNVIRAAKSPYNVNSITQAIGVQVLSDTDYLNKCIKRIITARNNLKSELLLLSSNFPEHIKVIAADANFVYTRVNECDKLFTHLKQNGILVRRFGDYLRITAGRTHETVQLITTMQNFFEGGQQNA